MKHSYNTLIHVWDIHQLINHFKEAFNWKRLYREAEDFQLKGQLLYSLWLGKEYFDTCVPQRILESLRSQHAGFGEKTFSWLLRHGKRKEKLCWLFYLSNICSWQNKLKFTLRTLCPSRDLLVQIEGAGNRIQSKLLLQVIMGRFQRLLGFFSNKNSTFTEVHQRISIYRN